jgi:IS4 transposase
MVRFCRDVATVDKWSAKATQIRNFETELSGILRELSNVKLNNVDRRVMELQKDVLEVLERLSDIQRGLEVWTSSFCEQAYLLIVLYRTST